MKDIAFFKEYGYMKDMEPVLKSIGDGRENSTSTLAANQIAHLKAALKELVSIVEIHSDRTNNNFAWAELDEAKSALSVTTC